MQYNLTYDGIFRMPLRNVDTKTTSGISHAISVVNIGSPENQDSTQFEDRIYIEPQTDILQEVGDFSLNDYANERWYGYYYNEFSNQWKYGSVPLLDYDLNAPSIIGANINGNLVQSWTSFDQTEYPENTTNEFTADTSVAANGSVENIYDGAVYSYSDVSNQTNNGTCSDVNYIVTRTWEGEAGEYNSGNTPAGYQDQMISVEDTQAPDPTFPENVMMEYFVGINTSPSETGEPAGISDNSNLETMVSHTDNSSQSNNGRCSDVHYTIARTWNVEDVCGNVNTHVQNIDIEDTNPPTYTIGENGPEKVGGNSGLDVTLYLDVNSTQGEDPTECNYYTYNQTTTYIMTDVCGNESSYAEEQENIDNEAPYIVSTPVPNGDTFYVPIEGSIEPNSTGWAE